MHPTSNRLQSLPGGAQGLRREKGRDLKNWEIIWPIVCESVARSSCNNGEHWGLEGRKENAASVKVLSVTMSEVTITKYWLTMDGIHFGGTSQKSLWMPSFCGKSHPYSPRYDKHAFRTLRTVYVFPRALTILFLKSEKEKEVKDRIKLWYRKAKIESQLSMAQQKEKGRSQQRETKGCGRNNRRVNSWTRRNKEYVNEWMKQWIKERSLYSRFGEKCSI